MKKILFFALVLVAGVVAFTGCKKDKNGADDKEKTLDPAALLNTSWRTDSVKVNGVQLPQQMIPLLRRPQKRLLIHRLRLPQNPRSGSSLPIQHSSLSSTQMRTASS